MPYVDRASRERIIHSDQHGANIRLDEIRTVGEVNFAIAVIARHYLAHHGTRYATFNDLIGALEAAKLEIYRRLVVPYEEDRMQHNEDVF